MGAGRRMGDALRLCAADPRDGAELARIYAPYVSDSTVSFETTAPDAAAMAQRIAARQAEGLPWIVARSARGDAAGYAYAAPYHPRAAYRFTVEPTVYVAQEAQGAGCGGMLYAALIELLIELRYRQAIALVAVPNAASEALHRRCGFDRTGLLAKAGYKFGQWIDVALYQRTLADGDRVDEPLALADSPRWRTMGGQ